MTAPAPPGSPAEAVQVAALSTLVGIAAGPEAGLLGSGWPAVLRTLSALHALQVSILLSWHVQGPRTCWRVVVRPRGGPAGQCVACMLCTLSVLCALQVRILLSWHVPDLRTPRVVYSDPEAGLVGTGWPAVLRILSALHALQVCFVQCCTSLLVDAEELYYSLGVHSIQ